MPRTLNLTVADTRWFSIGSDGRILDPDGDVFVPVGLNANGRNWVWEDLTIGSSGGMATWHFNTIRLNCFIRCQDGFPCQHGNDDIGSIVYEYTSRGYVVMLTQHTYGSTTTTDPAPAPAIADQIAFWEPLAAQFAENPYVWFNPVNEPTGGPTGYPPSDYGLNDWQNIAEQLGDAISAQAPLSMLVFDGHAAGQDKGHHSCRDDPDFTWGPFRYSAAIQRASALQARFGRDRVILSSHFYGSWAGNGTGGYELNYPACVGPPLDPFQHFREDTNEYLDTLRDAGIPILFGEVGARVFDEEEWFMVGSNDSASILLEQVAPARSTPKPGILFWHASGGDLRYLTNEDEDWVALRWDGDTGRLNWQGQAMLNYATSVNP